MYQTQNFVQNQTRISDNYEWYNVMTEEAVVAYFKEIAYATRSWGKKRITILTASLQVENVYSTPQLKRQEYEHVELCLHSPYTSPLSSIS
jgi:hypothetical protein